MTEKVSGCGKCDKDIELFNYRITTGNLMNRLLVATQRITKLEKEIQELKDKKD